LRSPTGHRVGSEAAPRRHRALAGAEDYIDVRLGAFDEFDTKVPGFHNDRVISSRAIVSFYCSLSTEQAAGSIWQMNDAALTMLQTGRRNGKDQTG
jgi:hypothetical protein